jgi:tetratricopeptide (TPR) repeat protein
VLLGVTLLQLKRFEEARVVLETACAQHGDDGSLLTNLAKAYAGLGRKADADATLWRAIEADPNQDNGLLWYVAIQKELGGNDAQEKAFLRVAQLPHSWRPQIWLARAALEAKDLDSALTFYREALSRMSPVQADALRQISGDLGIHGHLLALLTLVSPLFEIKLHGLEVGNNLIKANLDLGRTKEARVILEQLYRQQRVDWEKTLLFWDGEIDKAEKRYGPLDNKAPFSLELLRLEEPVWAREALGFASLLPLKNMQTPSVTFLAGTGSKVIITDSAQAESQPTDALGRMSRAIPLYLAEQVTLRTNAKGSFLQPWMPQGGFVLLGVPWDLDFLKNANVMTDYAVFMHIQAVSEPWQVEFDLIRVLDGQSASSWTQSINPQDPSAGIRQLEDELLTQLAGAANITSCLAPNGLESPDVAWLAHFTGVMEQALAVSCASIEGLADNFLYAERSIFNSLLQLSLQIPSNARMRMLLLSSIHREIKRKPDVAWEYKDRLARLQKEHAIDGAVGELIASATQMLVGEVDGSREQPATRTEHLRPM